MSNSLCFIITSIAVSFIIIFVVSACTLSFSTTSNMTHDGQSADTESETQSPSNDIKPAVTIPVSMPSVPSLNPSSIAGAITHVTTITPPPPPPATTTATPAPSAAKP